MDTEQKPKHLTAHVANYRQKKILEFVYQRKIVSNDVLADEFGVSKITIRRDLEVLANDTYLVRTHGGAMPVSGYIIGTISLVAKRVAR